VGLREKVLKLEREVGASYDTLYLPDGTQVKYRGEDALEALSACIEGEEHWLLPHLRKTDTSVGLPGLIRALETSSREVSGGS
jgi:hypothetical protein